MNGTPGVLSGTFASRYTIERELGHGATATVYLARDTQRNRAVAIKVLRPELAESVGAERFLREIKVTEQLQHAHIVPVFDSGEHEGALYFVLPHMEGGSLRHRMLRDKQLPIEEAVAIAHTIALALDYAHERGLIHRDVKPENILFTSSQACLADFGIARAIERTIDESTTSTGLVRGTPAYMSPEQASGSKDYDGRSDIFSLACVLYEMIAGIPAFIGPTPEAVIAQRFAYSPRELRVYRQSVPAALGAVIHKALQLTAADRYATAGDFAKALETAQRASLEEPRTSGPTMGFDSTRKVALLGAGLFAAAVVAAGVALGRGYPWSGGSAPDSSRVVVLSLQGNTTPGMDLSFRGAFARWNGITVPGPIDVSDAIQGRSQLFSRDTNPEALAAALDAGRYVRGRVQRVGTGFELDAGLYEAATNRELAHATIRLSESTANSDSTYFPLADSLLLRGALRAITAGTSSLPAAQTFARAMRSIEEWNLERADSLLQSARGYDGTFPLGALWLAQVRSWRGEGGDRGVRAEQWLPLAQIAASDSARLGERERTLVAGLIALGERRFADACRVYERLARRDNRDFAAWYGIGRCYGDDDAVMRDPASPTGWRFRSSYHRAALAYARAFELLPGIYRGMRRSAYQPLRSLLFTMPSSSRRGRALAPDTGAFVARPMWSGDSLLFIPYPFADGSRLGSPSDVASIVRAVERQRELFRRIALAWSAALPFSTGAKEAVAVALDMRGDSTALDTLRAGRRLSSDSDEQFRLLAAEALLLMKFGIPNNTNRLHEARRLADSLLAAHTAPRPGDSRELTRLAALTGKCELATQLAARDPVEGPVPAHVQAAARSLAIGVLMGCRAADDEAFRRIANQVEATVADPRERASAAANQLRQIALLAETPDTVWLARLGSARSGDLLRARLDVARGDTASARAVLVAVSRARSAWRPVDVSPDALLAETRLWLAVGDTAAAAALTGSVLDQAAFLPPEALAQEIRVASLMRLAQVHASIAPVAMRSSWRRALDMLQAPTQSTGNQRH